MLNTIVNHSSFHEFFDASAMMRSQSAVDCAAVFSAVALASAVALVDSALALTHVPAKFVIAVTNPIMWHYLLRPSEYRLHHS